MSILNRFRFIRLMAIMILLIVLSACTGDTGQIEAPTSKSRSTLTVTFNYEKQSGYASNQFAVWIEDADGNLIKTLYATRFTAKGGYKDRPDCIPTWVTKANLASIEKSEIDAVSGATPKAGTLSYVWDLTDTNGNVVSPGEYSFFVEGSLRWKNRVLYSGVIATDNAPATAEASAEYFYESSSDSQPALTGESSENSMIGTVTASFVAADVHN